MASTAAIINNTGTNKVNPNVMDINLRGQNQKKTDATSEDYASAAAAAKEREREPSNELTFEDMLMLMCTQLQNQSIDNTADTNDMMNQLISMTVMKSLTSLTQSVEEVETASIMGYASSLVGKEVTLGIYDENDKFQELYGTVEATGTLDGQQVVFVDGKNYPLSSIMAVGKLPPMEDDKGNGDGEENTNGVAGSGATGNSTDDNNNTTANGAEAANEVSGKPLPEAD